MVALLAAAGVWALWRGFVVGRTGRLLEAAALTGAEYGRNRLWQVAEPVLDVISVPFIAVVVVSAMVLAVLRRRALLAVQVALVVGGANLTTQLLKSQVLDRPDLDIGDRLVNTLPSGHTTVAGSCAVALVLAVPRRLRVLAASVGFAYTAGTGVSTLIGGWHRPSDVVAALLVVLAWTGLACALAPAADAATRANRRRETAAASLLVAGGMVAGAVAALALQRTLELLGRTGDLAGLGSRTDLLTAYGGGAFGVVAATALAFGVLLVLLRGPSRSSPRS